MEILPSEYQHLQLNRYEKIFVRHASSEESYGMLLLNINPAMMQGESIHAVISAQGIVLCKFLPINNSELFPQIMNALLEGTIDTTLQIVKNKFASNKALIGADGKLCFPVTFICVLPELTREEIDLSGMSEKLCEYVNGHCIFSKEMSRLRGSFMKTMNDYLNDSSLHCSNERMEIKDININSVLQRIAPEYTTVRFAIANDNNSSPGASEELLVISEDDAAVRAFRLDPEQINIVNKMSKGEQLILACAGSGKSVLLIAKCFKAASMNPDKKFLITCFNRNLQSLYVWFIERAGLKERNVECLTFDALCKRLLERNKQFMPGGINAIEERRKAAARSLEKGLIKDRYYGIFIDEVQMFQPEWYKFCYNLLENKGDGDHIFIICGDKTQEIKQRQRHGKAPWNVGEGYPVYRGGNKSIRIEKNFRNCIEINEYINVFAQNARELIKEHNPEEEFDPDMFLRGKAFRHGGGVTIEQFEGNAVEEAKRVVKEVQRVHDIEHIPYDEIAIEMYNRKFKAISYFLESALTTELSENDIPFNCLYNNDQSWAGRYGDGGVSLITFDSVLGLDFQAVVVCGIKPLGLYDKTKKIKTEDKLSEEELEQVKKNISYLYVACTRAKDYLHIVIGESCKASIYGKLLVDSMK